MIDPPPPTQSGTAAGGAMKDFRLGVLLVHGIGTQPPRDTLVRWGDVLLKLIGRATKKPGQVIWIASRGSAGDRSGEKPAEVAVDFRVGDHEERWLLAEGWWADSFPAPTYSELVSWSVRAVPWSIALHIAQRYWQTDQDASGRAKLEAGAKAVIQFLVAMALAPVFITLLALALLLGLLPIPQLRSLILSAQSTLKGSVGDSLAFVESPFRAALIRSRILEGLERLQARCEHTVIVAHSQGAAAALDALGGITMAADHDEKLSGPAPGPGSAVPDTLVTFGSGVNQLVSLRVLSAGLPERMNIGMNPASSAVAAILVMIGLLLFLYVSIRFQRTTVPGLVQAAVLYAVGLVSFALLALGANWVIDKLAAQRRDIKVWTMVALMLAVVMANIIYADFHDVPLLPVAFFSLALLSLAGSLAMLLSPDMKRAVTEPVRKPRGLTRWVDLYASADPVPNGPTRIAGAKSVPVWNRGSFLSDHTAYWDNLDGFVLRVARVCAETAKSPWQDKLPPATDWADRRAAWRVDLLRWAVRLNALLWLLAFVLLWTRYWSWVPLPFKLPTWAPPEASMTIERFAVLVVLVSVAAWATATLLRWPWSHWVRAEQELVLAHRPPTGRPLAPLICIGMVISLLVLLVGALARWDESMARKLLADPSELVELVTTMLAGGVLLAVIARWLRPAPQPPDTAVARTGKE